MKINATHVNTCKQSILIFYNDYFENSSNSFKLIWKVNNTYIILYMDIYTIYNLNIHIFKNML